MGCANSKLKPGAPNAKYMQDKDPEAYASSTTHLRQQINDAVHPIVSDLNPPPPTTGRGEGDSLRSVEEHHDVPSRPLASEPMGVSTRASSSSAVPARSPQTVEGHEVEPDEGDESPVEIVTAEEMHNSGKTAEQMLSSLTDVLFGIQSSKKGCATLSATRARHTTSRGGASSAIYPENKEKKMPIREGERLEGSNKGEVEQWRLRCLHLEEKLQEATMRASILKEENEELRRINARQVETLQHQAANEQKTLGEQVTALQQIKSELYSRLQTAETDLDYAIEARDKNSREANCSLCMENPADVVFFHCRHMCSCKECATKLRDCPICRQKIDHRVAVYLQ